MAVFGTRPFSSTLTPTPTRTLTLSLTLTQVMAVFVLLGTRLFNSIESTIGWNALPYLFFVSALAAASGS